MFVPLFLESLKKKNYIICNCFHSTFFRREFTIKGEPLSELAVSSDETFIATSSSNGHVYILDAHSLGVSLCLFVSIFRNMKVATLWVSWRGYNLIFQKVLHLNRSDIRAKVR